MSRGYRLSAAMRGDLSVADVIEHVAFDFGLSAETIVAGSNRRYVMEARRAVTWLAQRHTQATAAIVGAAIARTPGAVRQHVASAVRYRAVDAEFRELVDQVDQALTALRLDCAA